MPSLRVWCLVALFCACSTASYSQGELEVIFDDNFLEDPNQAGEWIFNGTSAWVAAPGDAPECVDEVTGDADPQLFDAIALPCNVYSETRLEDMGIDPEDFGGYILATPGANNQGGNAFRSEKASYDNFKMTVVVEMRDGSSLGNPADGMCVVVVGGDQPPNRLGAGGGGMGAPCVGVTDNEPMLVWEFDDWSCNTGDNGNDNHVGFAYSPTGFPCTDSVPPEVFVPIAPRLHTREAPSDLDGDGVLDHAPPNRVELTVFAQRCGGTLTVAADMNFIDQEVDLGRVFTHVVDNFEPFEGYLGVTGSTGGANQAHILHSAKLEELPDDFCLQPAASAERRIIPADGRGVDDACGDFQDGDDLTIEIALRNVRTSNDCCDAADAIIIRDQLPAGWIASNPSAGGTVLDDGARVEFRLSGVEEGTVASYTATAVVDENGDQFAFFSGTIVEDVAGSLPLTTGGPTRARVDSPFDACGAITCWNILGPYLQLPGVVGNNPSVENMTLDYLTDGRRTEEDFAFFPGATIATAFNNGVDVPPAVEDVAASQGLYSTGQPQINPDGVPTVLAHNDADGFINLNDDVYSNDPNEVMSYAQIYIYSEFEQEVAFAVSSDDSVQVILNDESIHVNSVARGGDSACNISGVVDRSIDELVAGTPPFVNLEEGENKLIIKTFEGGGGFNYSFRFEDELGNAITEGLTVSKYPEGICPVAPVVVTRQLDTGTTANIGLVVAPKWTADTEYEVTLALSDVRPADTRATCPDAAGNVSITETVPAGWEATNPSNGGSVSDGGRTITWEIDLGDAGAPDELTYTVTSSEDDGTVTFGGSLEEPGNDAGFAVGGVTTLVNPTDLTDLGFFKRWLLLGPYQQPTGFGYGAAISVGNMEKDWITDGLDTFEDDIDPVHGDQVNTAFAGSAAGPDESPAVGLIAGRNDAVGVINPDDVPTWFEWNDNDDTIAFEDYYDFDANQCMMFAFTRFILDETRDVQIGCASDDSIQVYLNGASVWTNSVARGSGAANEIQDTIPDDGTTFELEGGVVHTILVKVFEGGGGHNFRLRLQDELGIEITEGITLCLDRECGGDEPEPGFLRGDTDGNGSLLLNDSIQIFGWLFQGGPEPGCVAAADASGQGQVNLTSGIYGLNFLFTGGAQPPAPYPACGPGTLPSDAVLGCNNPHCN